MTRWAIAAFMAVIAAPAAAQDYDPSMSAHESMSQQQSITQQTRIYNGMLGNSARRNRGGGRATRSQIEGCAQKGYFRSRLGASNPRVQKLYSLCRNLGY